MDLCLLWHMLDYVVRLYNGCCCATAAAAAMCRDCRRSRDDFLNIDELCKMTNNCELVKAKVDIVEIEFIFIFNLPHSDEGNLMGVFVRVVNVGFTSELCAAALSNSVIVWVGCPAGPVTVTAAVCSSSPLNLAAVMLPNFLTCNTKPSLFCVMTMSLLSSRQSSSSNSSGVLSVCSDLSCLAVMRGMSE